MFDGDEGEDEQNSNIYQKKGEESQAQIPNPLENVRHQNQILQPNDQHLTESVEDDRINLCFALHTMNLKLGEILNSHGKEPAKDQV